MRGVMRLVDVGRYLRVDENEVAELVASGELPGFKVRDHWRVMPSDVKDYIRRRANENAIRQVPGNGS